MESKRRGNSHLFNFMVRSGIWTLKLGRSQLVLTFVNDFQV
jgi:hypothetical protein